MYIEVPKDSSITFSNIEGVPLVTTEGGEEYGHAAMTGAHVDSPNPETPTMPLVIMDMKSHVDPGLTRFSFDIPEKAGIELQAMHILDSLEEMVLEQLPDDDGPEVLSRIALWFAHRTGSYYLTEDA